jgi:hypothetical protein
MPITLNGSAGVTTNSGAIYDGIQRGTAVTASGTSVDFTGIPSWVKRITVMLSGVSTNGTSNTQIQLGDSGGIENTGYTGSLITAGAAANTAFSAGFLTTNLIASADTQNGLITIVNMTGNTWVASIVVGQTGTLRDSHGGGVKTLTDTLTQIRITTVNGTDTFDAGSINILYE